MAKAAGNAGPQPADPAAYVAAMLRIRRFEEQCIDLSLQGHLYGHYHVYIGQEATAVTACAALRPEDFIFSTWRNHGHLLARGADPERMMAEILGRSGGYAGGKSGTLHLAVRELGVPATSALVGGGIPLAIGAALACKRRGSGIAVCFFGDAGLEEGAFYEAAGIAALWKLPILFVCENNSIPMDQRRRGQYTSTTLTAAQLLDVPAALQIPSEAVDGTDTEALHACFASRIPEVRAGGGPRFLEIRAARWPGNEMLWPALTGGPWQTAWAFGEQPPQTDISQWLQSDPLTRYLGTLAAVGILDRAGADALDAKARAEMSKVAAFALASPFPKAEEAYSHVFAHGSV